MHPLWLHKLQRLAIISLSATTQAMSAQQFLQSDQETCHVEQAAMTIDSTAPHMHNSNRQTASQPSIHSRITHAEETPTYCNVRRLQMCATSIGPPEVYLLGILMTEVPCLSDFPPVIYIQWSQRSGQMPPKIPHNHGAQHQLEVRGHFIVFTTVPQRPLRY